MIETGMANIYNGEECQNLIASLKAYEAVRGNLSGSSIIDRVRAEMADARAGASDRQAVGAAAEVILPKLDACLANPEISIDWINEQLSPVGLWMGRNGPRLTLTTGGRSWFLQTLAPAGFEQGQRLAEAHRSNRT